MNPDAEIAAAREDVQWALEALRECVASAGPPGAAIKREAGRTALATLEAELRSLEARCEGSERESDDMKGMKLVSDLYGEDWLARAKRAEADNKRLREALEEIKSIYPIGTETYEIASAALASTSTPAAEGAEE